MSVRDEIYKSQHFGPLGEVQAALYKARDLLLEVVPHFRPSIKPVPLISLAIDDTSWRGRYESVGAFGMEHVITINVLQFNTALDACMTLAHELAHWNLYPNGSHSREWVLFMEEHFGLMAAAETGNIYGCLGRWHDLTGDLMMLGLDDFRFR